VGERLPSRSSRKPFIKPADAWQRFPLGKGFADGVDAVHSYGVPVAGEVVERLFGEGCMLLRGCFGDRDGREAGEEDGALVCRFFRQVLEHVLRLLTV
jgi:hypothetical protein